ncbi:Undecaprenyl-phosphate galactose phosphotransferase [Altererythrobacter insulae]|nr:Undecaprenyl-phosphate galactose phosphotransferase [Altererythrobacter insulae]
MRRPPAVFATAKSAIPMQPLEQVAFYFAMGIGLPATIWSLASGIPLNSPIAVLTLAQLSFAAILSWYVIDRLRAFAHARLVSYVLPTNLAIFGAILSINATLRLDFSFSIFLACAAGTLAISYLVTTRISRGIPAMTHYVIPNGNVDGLLKRPNFIAAKSVSHLEELVAGGQIGGSIIADLQYDHQPEWERLFANAALEGIPVYHYRVIEETLSGQVRIDHLRENEFGSLVPNLPYRYAKRILDICFVVLLSPLAAPLVGLLALAVKLDSQGSAFFVQERVGYRGNAFKMLKLRTMVERELPEGVHAQRDDAMTKAGDIRVTRIGRFLRKTRLDEVPQIWNVLSGEMSLIGPRPEAKSLADWYESEIPFYSYRHILRPGITGWSQVNQGHVTELESIRARVRYDFYYIKNLSLWLDIIIALKTVRVMATGLGAK